MGGTPRKMARRAGWVGLPEGDSAVGVPPRRGWVKVLVDVGKYVDLLLTVQDHRLHGPDGPVGHLGPGVSATVSPEVLRARPLDDSPGVVVGKVLLFGMLQQLLNWIYGEFPLLVTEPGSQRGRESHLLSTYLETIRSRR